jgi:hypothetical protein
MIVNSSELRAAGFDLREVLPLQLEVAAVYKWLLHIVVDYEY